MTVTAMVIVDPEIVSYDSDFARFPSVRHRLPG
jgi:hypothetical protein